MSLRHVDLLSLMNDPDKHVNTKLLVSLIPFDCSVSKGLLEKQRPIWIWGSSTWIYGPALRIHLDIINMNTKEEYIQRGMKVNNISIYMYGSSDVNI